MLSTSPVFRRSQWARWVLVSMAIADALALIVNFVPVLLGITVEPHFMIPVAVMNVLVTVATGVTFLMWIHAFIGALRGMNVELSDTAVSAVLWWFVPFANLVKPYLTLREALVGLRSEVLVDEARLGWWWGLYLVSNVASVAFSKPEVIAGATALSSIAALLGARLVGLAASALRDYSAPDAVVDALPLEAPAVLPAANA